MDGSRFDELTRSLARTRSRRSLLKLAIGSLGAAVATRAGATAATVRRGPGSICRNAADCQSGICGPVDRTGRRRCLCPVGQERCNGACLDPLTVYQSDPKNCGSCGRRCAAGAVCCNGDCVPVVAVCRGVCCASNQICAESGCCTPESVATTCAAECGARINNCGQPVDCGPCCGEVGDACGANGDCCSGVCVNGLCQAGPAATDAMCDDAADCQSGACCDGVCVDLASDVRHCGSCANACPGEVSECASPVCVEGGCGTSYAPFGTELSVQTAGDCRTAVCDGQGGATAIVDDADVPAQSDATCQVPTCAHGTVGSAPAPAGTPCNVDGGTLCDGSGRCVECLIDEDCGDGVCRSDNTCCTPEATEIVCAGACGEVIDACGLPVDCGACCEPEALEATCAGQCGPVLNNCGETVDCGACCVPDALEVTCAGQCGSVTNNCGAVVDCGACCADGYEIGSDGETCVPTEETCNIPINRGDLVMSNADFRECNFAGYEITGRYLNGADFTGANLAGAIFTRSNFSGAIFTNANLTGVIWTSAVCPDDTLAANHGNSCCNNLNGAVPASCS